MKLLRIFGTTICFTSMLFATSCGDGPIEHGTEYVLLAPDNSDTAEIHSTQIILEKRLNDFGLEGDFEISTQANQITVRIREGSIDDSLRIRNILSSSAELKFRATYFTYEVWSAIDAAQQAYLHINHLDSLDPATTGLFEYLIPAEYTKASPLVGYCRPEDTAAVNKFFRTDSVAVLLPPDLVFHWGPGVYHEKAGPTLALFTCKEGRNSVMDGDNIVSVNVNSTDNGYDIAIQFDPVDAIAFAKITRENVSRSLAIELDNFVYNYPTVNSEIKGGLAVITGNFTEEEAEDLQHLLSAGGLPVRLQLISETEF